MKRLLMLAVLSPAAILLFASSGSAQEGPFEPAEVARGFPLKLTATTTPRIDTRRPYTFTTQGRLILPSRYCDPGEVPRSGRRNCIPIICPRGVRDRRYCTRPGRSVLCKGTMTVRFQKGTTTISSRNFAIRSNCTYRSRVTFSSRLRLRVGVQRVRARWQGNRFLHPKSSPTQTIVVGSRND